MSPRIASIWCCNICYCLPLWHCSLETAKFWFYENHVFEQWMQNTVISPIFLEVTHRVVARITVSKATQTEGKPNWMCNTKNIRSQLYPYLFLTNVYFSNFAWTFSQPCDEWHIPTSNHCTAILPSDKALGGKKISINLLLNEENSKRNYDATV